MPVAIQCHDLRKTYDGKVEAVHGLNLEIETGECFGLLGPNGAGKTTTIEILEGLLEPTSGKVTILGHDWQTNARNAEALQRLFGLSRFGGRSIETFPDETGVTLARPGVPEQRRSEAERTLQRVQQVEAPPVGLASRTVGRSVAPIATDRVPSVAESRWEYSPTRSRFRGRPWLPTSR